MAPGRSFQMGLIGIRLTMFKNLLFLAVLLISGQADAIDFGPSIHHIEMNGSTVTQRDTLNFIGATVADNAISSRTDVTIIGGSGGNPGGNIGNIQFKASSITFGGDNGLQYDSSVSSITAKGRVGVIGAYGATSSTSTPNALTVSNTDSGGNSTIAFSLPNSAGSISKSAGLDSSFSDTTAGAEKGRLDFLIRDGSAWNYPLTLYRDNLTLGGYLSNSTVEIGRSNVSNTRILFGGNINVGSITWVNSAGRFDFSNPIVASSVTVSSLSSGQCVQTTTGGLLSTTGAPCGSGGSGGSITGTTTLTGFNPYYVLVASGTGTNLYTGTSGIRIDQSASFLGTGRAPNIIGGWSGNTIAATTYGNTIAGGGNSSFENKIFDSLGTQNTWMTISGGYDNQMDACWPSVIGGGAHNRINLTSALSPYSSYSFTPTSYTNHSAILSGTYNTLNHTVYCTIGGGSQNYMDPHWYTFSASQGSLGSATIGGGQFNFLTGSYGTISGGRAGWVSSSNSSIGGGINNSVLDGSSVIPGGSDNKTINGAYSTNFGLTNIINATRVPRQFTLTLGSQSSGTFELFLNNTLTDPIAYNASSTTVQSALELIVGVGSVTVSGASGGPYDVFFTTFGASGSSIANTTFLTMNPGSLGSPITATVANGNRYALSFTNVTGGTYVLMYGRDETSTPYPLQKTSALAYNASSATIQSALNGLLSISTGNCQVNYDSANTRYLIDIAPSVAKFNMFINGENLTGSGVTFAADAGTSPDVTGILSGRNNKQYGAYSITTGGRSLSNYGTYSFMGGGMGHNIAATSQYGTISGGVGHYMGGFSGSTKVGQTISGGQANSAMGSWVSVGGGNINIATGSASTIPGGQQNIAWGDYSSVVGLRGKSTRYGEHVIASGRFVNIGDAQSSRMTLRRQTTSATPLELAPDGSGTARLTTQSSTTLSIQLTVVGRRIDGGASEYAKYRLSGLVTREATVGTTAFLFQDKTVDYESDATWDVTMSASASSGVIIVSVTGAAAKTINWIAECVLVEVGG